MKVSDWIDAPSKRFVVDATQVFSCLLRDGSTRRTIFTTGVALYAPTFLRKEIDKHEAEILKRTGLSGPELAALKARVYDCIHWVSDEQIRPHLPAASGALASVDPKDVPYLACALAVRADAIWSNDEDYDSQNLVRRIRRLA